MNSPISFAGRVEELQILAHCLHRAAQGEPQIILIEGAAGVGKSALLQTFGRRAGEREKASWVFHIRPPDTGQYNPVSQAAHQATNKQLYEKIGGRRRAFESARELLPDWLAAIPGVGDLIAAITATIRIVQRNRRSNTSPSALAIDDSTDALLAAAVRHPLVLLFDDLHQADDAAIAQLARLIGAVAKGMKLLLVGTYRPAPPGAADPPIQRLIATLPQSAVRYRQLKELTEWELRVWLRKRFPHVVIPNSFLQWLFDRSGGHAETVESLLAQLVDRSVIRFIDRHWEIQENFDEQAAGVETTSSDNLAVDLSSVSPTVLDVLRAASSLGDEFDGFTLALLLQQDELHVEDQLALAAHHKIVESLGEITLDDGEIATLFRFTSSHLRSVLARDLKTGDRANLVKR